MNAPCLRFLSPRSTSARRRSLAGCIASWLASEPAFCEPGATKRPLDSSKYGAARRFPDSSTVPNKDRKARIVLGEFWLGRRAVVQRLQRLPFAVRGAARRRRACCHRQPVREHGAASALAGGRWLVPRPNASAEPARNVPTADATRSKRTSKPLESTHRRPPDCPRFGRQSATRRVRRDSISLANPAFASGPIGFHTISRFTCPTYYSHANKLSAISPRFASRAVGSRICATSKGSGVFSLP